jgi:hypothetical protein
VLIPTLKFGFEGAVCRYGCGNEIDERQNETSASNSMVFRLFLNAGATRLVNPLKPSEKLRGDYPRLNLHMKSTE